MLPGFAALVEERIQKAQKEGAFDNLDGAHKPLRFDDQQVPEEYRLAYKILKNAGFLPPEVELRKHVYQTEQLLCHALADSPEHQKLQKKLNFLLAKLNTLRGDRPLSPILADTYREQMIQKLS